MGEHQTPHAYPRVHLREDGIMHVDFGLHPYLDMATVQRALDLHRDIAPSLARPVMVTMDGAVRTELDAELLARGDDAGSLIAAMAVVTRSVLGTHVAQQFMWYRKPELYPVRLFGDEAEALAWLKPYRPPA